ncbi:MAG TPA: PQQ-dependent sugar dehydrogenase [Gemmatimonadaceae bacterium]|nr:PQQ-dependent sugar dehydrogenase [Gemmatimonadaceae bacterium]
MLVARRSISTAMLLAGSPALAQTAQPPRIGELPPAPAERYVPEPPGIAVTVFASGLEAIWSLQFAPDGRLFLTERPGRIRVVTRTGRLDETPWATVDAVNTRGEGGLLGLALHPRFAEEPWVYVMYTARKNGGIVNRVVRVREVDGRGANVEVVLDDLPAATNHNGGRLRFGPDGMLYVGAGDAYVPERAQDRSSPAGAILRLTPEGRVPDDNPWRGNPIWALGLRNPNALAFRPRDGVLFAGDHGPTSEWRNLGIRDRDELNIVRKGANYGWPVVVGAPALAGFVDPLLAWDPSAPPGDLVFYDAALLPALRGDLFLSTLRAEALIRIRFGDTSKPDRVTAIERWFNSAPRGMSVYGRLRGLTVGPDGALYVGTSNRDGRGQPRPGDDRVLRIGPGGR